MKKIKNVIIKLLVVCTFIFLLTLFQGDDNGKTQEEAGLDAKESLAEFDSGCVVLNYHLIRSNNPLSKLKRATLGYDYDPVYNIYEDEFARQMQVLKEKNIDVYSLDELTKMMEKNKVPNHCVALTFDDIDESVYDNAYEILQQYNYPFTIFIVTGKLPTSWGLIQENNKTIKKMAENKLTTVGLHTDSFHDMDDVTSQPRFLDPRNNKAFDKDTKLSIKKYKELLGKTPRYFAYPHGFGTKDTDEILVKNGLDVLFTLRGGAVDETTDEKFIPRVLISPQAFEETIKWLEKTNH